jgi:serine/threonine protein kinase
MSYKIIKYISDGAEGTVYEAIKEEKIYALKVVPNKKASSSLYLQKDLCHPNIVKVFEIYEDEYDLNIIMELCGETLKNKIDKHDISKQDIKNYLEQIISAIKYLETHDILHNDINVNNILISKDLLKLTDFGSAEKLKNRVSTEYFIGYSWHMAPEMCSSGYTYSINVWQIGILLHYMIFKEYPFSKFSELISYLKNPKYCYNYIQNNKVNIKSQDLLLVDLLSQMLSIDPLKRISLDEVLLHPYFD